MTPLTPIGRWLSVRPSFSGTFAVSQRLLSTSFVLLALLIVSGLAGAIPAVQAAGSEPRLITAAKTQVEGMMFSPDNRYLVYVANAIPYSVALPDGAPQPLSSAAGFDFAITSDSARIVFTGRRGNDVGGNVYSVAPQGGTPVRLSTNLGGYSGVAQFLLSPDGKTVVYLPSNGFDSNEPRAAYSVPVNGGTPIRLNTPLQAKQSVAEARISPDNSRVIYELNNRTPNPSQQELWSVPLTGGTPVKLVGPYSIDDSRVTWQIEPRSRFVIYTRIDKAGQPSLLYRVPIGGGTPVKLNMLTGVSVSQDVKISADGAWVVFNGGDVALPLGNLYRTPVDGPEPAIKLNTEVAGSVLRGFLITPDSSSIVYVADIGPFTTIELYSVPVMGGTPTKINGPLDTEVGAIVDSMFAISPDSRRVVYAADQKVGDSSGSDQLWSAPITGNAPTIRIDNGISDSASVKFEDLKFSSDSESVFFRAEADTGFRFELYAASLKSATPARKLNGTIPSVAGPPYMIDLFSRYFKVSASDRFIAFAAANGDDAEFGERGLYLVDLNPGPSAPKYFQYLPAVTR